MHAVMHSFSVKHGRSRVETKGVALDFDVATPTFLLHIHLLHCLLDSAYIWTWSKSLPKL